MGLVRTKKLNATIPGALTVSGAVTAGGQVLAPDGSATVPGHAYTSETNTGFARTASGVMRLALAGTYSYLFAGSSLSMLGSQAAQLNFGTSSDVSIARSAAGSLTFGGQSNGQLLGVKTLTELTTIAAAATTDTTILQPAGAIILAVSVRVTVVIPTAATFTVGDAGTADRFNTAAVTVAANSTDKGTKAGAYYNAAATAVRITPDLTPGANTGRVRVTVHYIDATPATS